MKAKENTAHTVEWSKDPLTDRERQINTMKGFKGSSWPKRPFKDAKVRQEIDAPYTPHGGGESK